MNKVQEKTYVISNNTVEGYSKNVVTGCQFNSIIDEINDLQFKVKVLEDKYRWKNWRWK